MMHMHRRHIKATQTHSSNPLGFETLSVDFFPRESHVITFRDPWSFPVLYHPACNNLVRDHMQLLAQKVILFMSSLACVLAMRIVLLDG